MDPQQFYKRFDGLEATINHIHSKISDLNRKIYPLEERLNPLLELQKIITELKRAEKPNHPLGDEPLYFFVKEITENDIISSDAPSLREKCPNCGKLQPVLMKYTATDHEGSDDERDWEKQALIICKNEIYLLDKREYQCENIPF